MSVNPGPVRTPFHEKADPSLAYAHKYDAMMLVTLLAKDIIDGIIKRKCEINQPKWMHSTLKFYQIFPRFIESLFPFLFKTNRDVKQCIENVNALSPQSILLLQIY